MKTNKLLKFIFIIFLCFSISGCSYHNLQPGEVDTDKDLKNFSTGSATKCHVIDGSVIVYRNGFTVDGNIIRGIGDRFYFTSKTNSTIESFPLDSIAAITTYEDYSGARTVANGSLGFLGTVISGLTVYCLSCPKCCFGSCPTVYTFDNNFMSLETELFSSSISRMLEDNDLDKLKQKIPDNGVYKINITNEALETHYIDKFNLMLAEHPLGTIAYPNIGNGFTVIDKTVSLESAFNSDGVDILKEISTEDTISYRSGMGMVRELKNGPKYDWIDFTSLVPEDIRNAKILVRYKNTLLSTILFYDVVLGSQGIKSVEWIDKMNNDPVYAEDFKMIYDNFSGMKFEICKNGKWISAGKFPDAGPICWKHAAAEISVADMKEIKFRLKFIPDNFMIDFVGIEFGSDTGNNVKTVTVIPFDARNNTNGTDSNAIRMIENTDKNYLVTNPGDSYSLNYNIKKRYDIEQTVFISSKGYYNEWIRGSWIKNDTTVRTFDLYNINKNLKLIAESWETNKALIESEFFNTRIPVKEK